jgi:hypothetical protein
MKFDMADVKPSVISWLIVGIMAVTFIVFMKFILNRYPVSGLTEFFNAV